MRLLSFSFILIFGLNVAAQSPAVNRLFADATKDANQGRFEQALKNYKTALFAAENEYIDAGFRARLHYNIGVCYFHLDRLTQAADEFRSALLLKSNYVKAHYALGMTEIRRKKWKAARASLVRVTEIDPKNGEAWFDLAFAELAGGDVDSASTAFARSIEFGSKDLALSHNNIGVILAIKGDLRSAESRFESAIKLSAGRLTEARRNLEFCRAKRTGGSDLVASDLAYAAGAIA